MPDIVLLFEGGGGRLVAHSIRTVVQINLRGDSSHTSRAKSLAHSAETTAIHHFTANAISEIFKRQKLVSEFPTPFVMVSF